MNSVVHFEVPADDLKRAQEFYNKTFGWKTTADMGSTLIVNTSETGEDGFPIKPGRINGDIFKRDDQLKQPLIVIDVANIEEKTKEIEANGGTKLTDKIEIPEMGWCLYFKDTEGNVLGIWQSINM